MEKPGVPDHPYARPMRINLTRIFVADQDKALAFYTESLGFVKKDDFTNGPFRWLTVASAEDPDGTQLQLALNNEPAGAAYQKALYEQHQPAAMFATDDVQADHDRLASRGVTFVMPPTKVTGSTIALLDDGLGNLVQLTQLDRRG